ncbi:hypothetical protein LCGC14_1025140 [marine sediment metagenome]|uniref:Uncharacterized protein n=1 Tax=marine sediment metagenome TaxID=412755 RepID=A0A0F9N0T1_9ZZZZ
MTQTKVIPNNYVWYHGGIMTEYHTNMYNEMSREIAELQRSGFNKDHLERLLNSRHMLVEFYIPTLI